MRERSMATKSLFLAATTVLCSHICAQSKSNGLPDSAWRGRFWPAVEPYVDAAAPRLRAAGKERVVMTATIRAVEAGPVLGTVQVISQWPGLLRLDGDGRSLALGQSNQTAASVPDQWQKLAEAMLEDSFEGFLYTHNSGGATRFIGRGYADASRPGEAFDIFSMMAASRSRAGAPRTAKMYFFDTRSKLLAKVQYIENGAAVEVAFLNWTMVDGNRVPGKIVRREAGREVLNVTLSGAGFTAKAADGLF